MKWSWIALSATLATAVVAQPHRHQHRHGHEKRSPGMKVVYMLDNKEVTEDFVRKGIEDGTLVFVGGQPAKFGGGDDDKETPVAETKPISSPPSSPAEYAPTSTSSAVTQPSPVVAEKKQEEPAPSPSPSEARKEDKQEAKDDKPKVDRKPSSGGDGVDRDFPDGEVDCSHFPAEYGAVPLEHLNLGGWTGLQKVKYTADGSQINHIDTMIEGPCGDGMMCSYACPVGYEKAQWPKEQGSTGQSIGGIACKNGKLYLPGGGKSQKLCTPGVGGVKVHNKVGKSIPVCRTDYPGTESMTIPATYDPSQSEPYELTCPDSRDYYRQNGADTSAQYYVNPAGTSIEEACVWGDGGNTGNWAPMNIGVSRNNGVWLSIFQNEPTNTDGKLDFGVRIVGDDLSCECKYENGQYFQDGKHMPKGCTVKVNSGEATFEFY